MDPYLTVAPLVWTLPSSQYSSLVFLPHSIFLFFLKTLKVHSLAVNLQPFDSNIQIKINFFCKLETWLTSVNVRDLLSAMRNWTDLLPTTLFAILFAIHTSTSSHAAYVENISLSLHKW